MGIDTQCDWLVVGGGVVGLAIAEALSRKHSGVVLVEKESRTGMGTSSRNSEVIHSGIYYPKDSKKTVLCLRGRELLYDLCQRHGISHAKTGKLLVATQASEIPALENLVAKAKDLGMNGVQCLNAKEVREREPQIIALAGAFVPESGIVSAHGLMDFLERKFLSQNGTLVMRTQLREAKPCAMGYQLTLEDKTGRHIAQSQRVINAAGLYADDVAFFMQAQTPKQHFCKGNYFKVKGARGLFKHLVYPTPEKNLSGLGIHITLDLQGDVRLGPDVEWLFEREENYRVDASRLETFRNAVSRFWPAVSQYELIPDFSGIRPKISPSGEASRDFYIEEDFPGWVNLLGIESPGLTAALAIAEMLARRF